jgi:hypothetical protein
MDYDKVTLTESLTNGNPMAFRFSNFLANGLLTFNKSSSLALRCVKRRRVL